MNTATLARSQGLDIATQISFAMRSMGISPLPRNYELFYEAYIGSNPVLTRRVTALGSRATQDDLDRIAEEFFGHNSNRIIENAHSRLVSELDNLLRLMKQEQSSLETYNKLLDETCSRINAKSSGSVELLRNAIALLTRATDDTLAHGEKTAESFTQKSVEMDAVRRELDEYKRIANTDSLTRLANRRAFDERMAGLFNYPSTLTTTSLMLIDIDHFKKINDTFGHPVGDKILATVAGVIRANAPRDAFVARAGGEEFAIIVEGMPDTEVFGLCERIRTNLENTLFRNSRTGVNYGPVTVSIGFALAANCQDPGELYSRSDIALYCAKNAGRNCSRPFEPGMRKDFAKGWLIYKG
ncbi:MULTISPECIES: GGDEF domain-containing protein [Rhizobium/Agrobacterium group]|uniref:diguanylate cyclase n=1 Tax=Agrobacterium vitis TaxID=373 RepID=A0AAE2RG92_AGRVI|nr:MULTISPECIES: GGDEF domain-containing protein [Rhizobium/Agrobacterium group]MBF2716190.1 diguanylate cyclase [Agrobacterium vitis]MCF1435338.1 diguanylate cyclase [Allorhizobium ampelinum]MCF1462660.1 diguanylate cyclase [Allorhizobium ampelinum]MCF1471668.1 diguanylate cyclase [Allorhizobium ampelinum]MCF1481590.1 diguanylate cyclase [Allorhizobium ampelinum]